MFSKPLSAIEASDLQKLLEDQAEENVRLEFKREMPSKDELLKKLSSFANTFGGYLIIGAAEDGTRGRLSSLPGIPPQANLKQTIIQWCFSEVHPPLTAEVSSPIPLTDSNVCYVVYVPESDLAPHFLNKRKGIYVRTDEHSQRFRAELGTQNELLSLFNKRVDAVNRRTQLINRTRERFNTLVKTSHGSATRTIGATLGLSIIPKFPHKPITPQNTIVTMLQNTRFNWRQVSFPIISERIVSQNESAIILQPASNFSMLELNTWGLMHYATEIVQEMPQVQSNGIHMHSLVGHILTFLKHASLLADQLNIMQSLHIEIELKNVLNAPWIYADRGVPTLGPSSPLDDEFIITIEIAADELKNNPDNVAMNFLKLIFFSLNWASRVDSEAKLRALIESGYAYNFWPISNPS